MSKKLLVITASCLLAAVIAGGIAYAAAQPVSIVVNGQAVTSDTAPQLINGRTMVPLGVIAESLGASVVWDAARNRVEISTAPSLKLLKVNGEATTWPYWYVSGRLYMEQRNLVELLRMKYASPWYAVTYTPSNHTIHINGQETAVQALEQDGFTTIPLDSLQLRNNLNYSFDPETHNLTVNVNQKY